MLKIEDLSYWERNTFLENIDFLIVGAGIVGYSSALQLREQYPNAKIMVLERGYLPSGASSKNAGFACFGSVTELLDDLEHIPEEKVWKTVEKRWNGLQNLRKLIGDDALDLQLHGSWDIITKEQTDALPEIREKLAYLNKKIAEITGEENVYSEEKNLSQKFGFEEIETSFYNRLEGQINTGSMIRRFYQLTVERGIDVVNGLNVLSFSEQENFITVLTSAGELSTKNLLICTNGFAKELLNEDVLPARAQVLVTSPIPDLNMKGTFHYDKGYYYFRNIDNRILLGGGRNLNFEGETSMELETTDQIMSALENLLHTVILPNTSVTIDYRWAGIMGVGKTKEPIIRKIHPRIGIGVRMGGMGVAIGSLVGKELAEMF